MSNQTQTPQNLPIKANWSQAPKGYSWFAIDQDGTGWWHTYEPISDGRKADGTGYWSSIHAKNKSCFAGYFDPTNWRQSKQQRPEAVIDVGQPTIDWSTAPEWANYFTIDKDRMAFWHENKPNQCFTFWNSNGQKASIGFVKGIYDWEKSLQQRQKTEGVQPDEIWADEVVAVTDGLKQRSKPLQITCHFNTEISGYLAGENSFITGLVDLLLARMAKEERFSDDVVLDPSPFDICKGSKGLIYGQFIIITDVLTKEHYSVSGIVLSPFSKCTYRWISENRESLLNTYNGKIRQITEIEAVEFRKAMEAVYG